MNWKKDKIFNDIKEIISYDSSILIEIEDAWNPAESYCSEIYLTLQDLNDGNNCITICGFVDDGDISDSYNPIEDIPLVEIKDLNGNGLSKRANKRVKELYNKLVDYFNQFDVEVVDDLHKFF